MANLPLVSVITDAFYKVNLLRESVESVLRQSYTHLELILIDNGAMSDVKEYINEIEAKDRRVKVIHFEDNQYSPDDPMLLVEVCYNAGLKRSRGDLLWYQSYDDFIAPDYLEKMVDLFKGNSECITAAGLPIVIDSSGKMINEPSNVRLANRRPRYMPGHKLALDHLRGGSMYRSPGTIFTIRRDVLIKGGGYQRDLLTNEIYNILPFGITGFDDTAYFYWRRHDNQLSMMLNTTGYVFTKDAIELLNKGVIKRKWQQVFGNELAKEVDGKLRRKAFVTAADVFAVNLGIKPMACLKTLRIAGRHFGFWVALPLSIWVLKRSIVLNRMKSLLFPVLKRFPSIAKIHPRMGLLLDRTKKRENID